MDALWLIDLIDENVGYPTRAAIESGDLDEGMGIEEQLIVPAGIDAGINRCRDAADRYVVAMFQAHVPIVTGLGGNVKVTVILPKDVDELDGAIFAELWLQSA